MRRLTMLGAVSALVVGMLGALGSTTAGAAPSSLTCTGTPSSPTMVPAGTYSSLILPPGSACVVSAGAVSVSSPVTIGAGAVLAVFGGSFTSSGPVSVGTGAIFAAPQNTTPITINGPVTVGQNAVFLVGVETPGGPLFSAIRGPVKGTDASSIQIHNTQVNGGVTSVGGGADNALFDELANQGFPQNFFDLEDNHINGPVSITGYTGEWAGVIRDMINGPLTFSNNTESPIDEYDIGSLVVNGPATCSNNTPAPNIGESPGGPSTVHGPILGNQAATCVSAA